MESARLFGPIGGTLSNHPAPPPGKTPPLLGHFPEWFLRRKLYLDFSEGREARYRVPEHVPIPEHRGRPELALLMPGNVLNRAETQGEIRQ